MKSSWVYEIFLKQFLENSLMPEKKNLNMKIMSDFLYLLYLSVSHFLSSLLLNFFLLIYYYLLAKDWIKSALERIQKTTPPHRCRLERKCTAILDPRVMWVESLEWARLLGGALL